MKQLAAEMAALMALDGYERVARNRAHASIDRAMAVAMVCPRCGFEGHELYAFERDGSYRAIVICRNCKAIDDF